MSTQFSKSKQSLLIVVEKVKRDQLVVSACLKKLSDRIELEKEQAKLLQGYKESYLKKIRSQECGSIADIHRYRYFCNKINIVLRENEEKIKLAQNQLIELRRVLSLQQHKRNILNELIEKKVHQFQSETEKKIQSNIEEFSANMHFRQLMMKR